MFSIEDYVNFQYPLTRPYRQRWRYTTHVLLVFACISLVGFAALNVALVGYDVVTVISDNFNASYSASWTLSWDDQIQGCQTHIYQLGDSFRTNNSAFTYSIYNVMSTSNSSGGSGNVQGSFSYANNSLANCDVTSIELNVLPGDRSVGANVAISCPELGFEASTSWGYTNYQPVGALAPSTFAYNSLARATWDVLTGFGSDAYWPIYYGQYVFNGTSPTQLLYRVTTLFTPSNNSLNNEEPSLSISWYNGISLTNLSIVANTGNYAQTVTAGTSTLQNLAQALYASIRLDLGHWTANNILTNKLAYDAVIQPGQSFADSTLNSNTAPAYVNFTSPPAVDVSTPPSVAQMQYTCTIRQMKTGGSMFMSVAAATLAMFLSAWGAITAILSSVARNGPGANTCIECGGAGVSHGNPHQADLSTSSGHPDHNLLTPSPFAHSFIPPPVTAPSLSRRQTLSSLGQVSLDQGHGVSSYESIPLVPLRRTGLSGSSRSVARKISSLMRDIQNLFRSTGRD